MHGCTGRVWLLAWFLAASACGAGPAHSEASALSSLAAGDHTVTIGGQPIAYHVIGRGPVCVVWPGGPGLEWTYLRSTEAEAHLTMVYVEPVGTGSSGRLRDPAGYTMSRYVSDLEALRAHLGLERMCLLGHSFGGMVALRYAVGHLDRLSALILYDTSPTTGPDWAQDVDANLAWYKDRPWFADATAALGEEEKAPDDQTQHAVMLRELPLYFADWDAHGGAYRARFASVRVWRAPLHGTAEDYDVRPQLGQIAAPTLIISGARDFICSPRFAHGMRDSIRSARLVTLAHSGHFGHIEEPAAFGAAIGAFAASLP